MSASSREAELRTYRRVCCHVHSGPGKEEKKTGACIRGVRVIEVLNNRVRRMLKGSKVRDPEGDDGRKQEGAAAWVTKTRGTKEPIGICRRLRCSSDFGAHAFLPTATS